MVCRAILKVGLSLLAVVSAFAQPQRPDTLWTKRYGGLYNEINSALCLTLDNGYLLSGSAYLADLDIITAQLFKTDSLGNLIWARQYGGNQPSIAYDITQTDDNGYLAVGYISMPNRSADVYIVKIESNGDTCWTQSYGGLNDDRARSVHRISDDGFIVAGFTESFGHPGTQDMYLLRLNNNGDTLWTKTYGTLNREQCEVVKVMPSGGFIFAGLNDIVRTDMDGDTIWTRKIDADRVILSMCLAQEGGIIITGTTQSGGPYGGIYVERFADSGDSVWMYNYPINQNDYARPVSITYAAGGGYILTGEGAPECQGMEYFTDIYIWRIDTNGILLWYDCYNLTENDESMAILPTSDGGYAISGQTHTPGRAFDMFLIKTRPDPLDVPSDHIATIPMKLEISAYPNPFNSSTTIVFSISQAAAVKLNIYNLIGDRVCSLVDEWLVPGTYRARFDGEALSSGVYFCRMETGTVARTRKIVLMK